MPNNQSVEHTYRVLNRCLSAFVAVALLTVGAVWAYQSKDKLSDPFSFGGHIKQTHSKVMNQALQQIQSGQNMPNMQPGFDTSQMKMYDWSKYQSMDGSYPFQTPSPSSSSKGFGTRR
jgi:hypothetical protein